MIPGTFATKKSFTSRCEGKKWRAWLPRLPAIDRNLISEDPVRHQRGLSDRFILGGFQGMVPDGRDTFCFVSKRTRSGQDGQTEFNTHYYLWDYIWIYPKSLTETLHKGNLVTSCHKYVHKYMYVYRNFWHGQKHSTQEVYFESYIQNKRVDINLTNFCMIFCLCPTFKSIKS